MNLRVNSVARLVCGVGLVGGVCVSALGGCDRPASAGAAVVSKANTNEFVDHGFGFRATPPSGWRAAPSQMVTVPGEVVQVWARKGVQTIVAFTQNPGYPVSAGQLLSATAGPMSEAGCKVSYQKVVKIGGFDAMSVKLTGKGTGGAIGRGNLPTYQHWVAIPRADRVLVLLLTAPDVDKSAAKDFEEMIESLKLEDAC